MLDVVSLFSGIEGFGLGLERTGGFRVVAQVEQDPYCLSVLERHWPHVPRFPDVREVGAHNLPRADVITGGFPCQGISWAGLGLGLADERSGLWSEMLRVIRELRPRWVVVENVSALLVRGLDVVLGGLAAIGYDAEWDCIPASAAGAPHRRDRVWLVAYPRRERVESGRGSRELAGTQGEGEGEGPQPQRIRDAAGDSGSHSNADDKGRRLVTQHDRGPQELGWSASRRHSDGLRHEVADTNGSGRDGRPGQLREAGRGEPQNGRGAQAGAGTPDGWWATEPDVGRVAHGIPARVDRLRALGNALVPQIPEWIGYRILDYEEGRLADAA